MGLLCARQGKATAPCIVTIRAEGLSWGAESVLRSKTCPGNCSLARIPVLSCFISVCLSLTKAKGRKKKKSECSDFSVQILGKQKDAVCVCPVTNGASPVFPGPHGA